MRTVALDTSYLSGSDSTDSACFVNHLPVPGRIVKIYIVPKSATATHASNYITTTITNGDTSGTVATQTTNSSGGVALTANTPAELTLSGTGKDLEISAGGKITVAVAKSGTGPAYNFSLVVVLQTLR